MQIKNSKLNGLKIITPEVYKDERGFFLETYNQEKYIVGGIDCDFVQDNHSKSIKNTLRGMHFQTTPGQAKLIRVIKGTILDVAVDIRPNSETFKMYDSIILSDENHLQFFIPVGFAHGFVVLSDYAEVCYKCSSIYNPETESGFYWNDPEIGINWMIKNPIVSKRDANAKTFKEVIG